MQQKCAPQAQILAGERWQVHPYGRVPRKSKGLYGQDEDQLRYQNGMEMSQNQIGRHLKMKQRERFRVALKDSKDNNIEE